MGKRSDFERRKMDFYPTPYKAVKPLFPFLPTNVRYCEPCAGAGDLIKPLQSEGHVCTAAYDVDPLVHWIERHDASFLRKDDLLGASMIITNPPWERDPLHQIIDRCAYLAPSWLLFDSDWAYTRQAKPHLLYCHKIVSVGRVKWIEDSNSAGKDNCSWYLFDGMAKYDGTRFYNV